MNVAEMALPALLRLREEVTTRIDSMRESGIEELRNTMSEQARLLGIDLKDLMPKKTRKRRAPRDED